jgi:ABC-2 type transport system permease protein
MADARLALSQAHYALLAAIRVPRMVVFGVVFPIILLVLFDAVFTKGSDQTIEFGGGTLSASAYFTAGITAFAVAQQAFTSLVVGLTAQRETGQLKRLRATPMPVWTFVAGQVLRCIALTWLMAAALLVIGAGAFGVSLSAGRVVGYAVVVALGTLVFCALAMALTARTPTVDSASAVGPFVVVMLSFISGVFVAADQLPESLARIGRFFPLYHVAHGLDRVLAARQGIGLDASDLFALAIWGVAGTWVAVRRFRWEPMS